MVVVLKATDQDTNDSLIRRFSKLIQFENIVAEARRRQRFIPKWLQRKEVKDIKRRTRKRHLSAKRRVGFKTMAR